MMEREGILDIVELSLPADTKKTVGARIENARLDARWNLNRSQSTSAAKSFFGQQAARFDGAVEKAGAIYETLAKVGKITVEQEIDDEQTPSFRIWVNPPEDDQSIALIAELDRTEFDVLTQILLPTHEDNSIRNAQNRLSIDSISMFLEQQNHIDIRLPSSPVDLELGISPTNFDLPQRSLSGLHHAIHAMTEGEGYFSLMGNPTTTREEIDANIAARSALPETVQMYANILETLQSGQIVTVERDLTGDVTPYKIIPQRLPVAIFEVSENEVSSLVDAMLPTKNQAIQPDLRAENEQIAKGIRGALLSQMTASFSIAPIRQE